MEYVKTCVICGEQFVTTVHNKSVCDKSHIHPCPVCGKDVLCNDPKRQNCACSRKCGQQIGNASRIQSNLDKYGVDNVAKLASVKSSISAALKTIYPKAPKQYKVCEVCGKQFELSYPYTQHTCSPKCRGEFRKRTGVSKSVYAKACDTNLARYGVVNPGQRPEIHVKMEDTMEARYGVRYARYLPEVEERVRNTCMARYGVPYYIQTEDANRDNVVRISKLNLEFAEMLRSNGVSTTLEKYIDGKFYDIAVDDSNILIELDPTYTHNAVGNHWASSGLDANYHVNKSRIACDAGYRCIHVFDWDEWESIVSLLIEPNIRLYARNCEVRGVSKSDADRFTAANHIQGRCNGQVLNYGLYHDNKLIEIMTFGKPRYNNQFDYELLRLCTQRSTRVVGGASKLFSKFCHDNRNSSVISYCDLAKFTGSVYSKLGMQCTRTTPPNKIWSKGTKKITSNLLNQRGYDQLFGTNYGKGTSNEQLMLDNGWLPVYDCGQAVWEYHPN